MKTTIETREILLYICETCQKEFSNRSSAEHCEREHRKATCKHPRAKLQLVSFGEDCARIVRDCPDCWREETVVDLSDLRSEELEKVVAALKPSDDGQVKS